MALTGNQQAYLQARSGIARSAAIRSNYVFPLDGVISVGGVDLTRYIRNGSLNVTMAINEEPDTASFDVMLTDATIQSLLVVGADVVIGLGGAAENVIFGGRILTAQTTVGPITAPRMRSVMCADYLQVLDSEFLITYDWPPQSATQTIHDLIARFANKPGGVAVSLEGVQPGLPNHATVAVSNEKFSTVLRRLVTMFPGGGGFYVDPLRVLHVWTGLSEPGVITPAPLTLTNPTTKGFAETVDGSQQRDAVIVEGHRTTAPIGMVPDPATDPAFLVSMPVGDASIIDKITDVPERREIRVGTQRLLARYAEGVWSCPPETPQTTTVTADVAYEPDPAFGPIVAIGVADVSIFGPRNFPWVKIDEQWLKVMQYGIPGGPYIHVPRFGWGGLIGELKAGAVVTAVDSLADIVTTGRYDAPGSLERVRAQPIDCDVVMTVRAVNGLAIHEHIVQDGRYTREGAGNRASRELSDFRQELISIQFETTDLNAKPGRRQAYNLIDPTGTMTPLVGDYMILTATLTWPVWGQVPRRVCTATEVHPADIVDAWLVDKG